MPSAHVPHNDKADWHESQVYCTQNAHLNKVALNFDIFRFVLEGQPGLPDTEEKDQQTHASEAYHDIGWNCVVHVVFVVLTVCDFVEHRHDDIDET